MERETDEAEERDEEQEERAEEPDVTGLPSWVRRALDKANKADARYRIRTRDAETAAREEREKRETAEKRIAELEAAAKEDSRLDLAILGTLADIGVREARKVAAAIKPFARFDAGRVVVSDPERGPVPLVAAIPPDFLPVLRGGGGKRASPVPSASSSLSESPGAFDPIARQSDYGRMTPTEKRAFLEKTAKESR